MPSADWTRWLETIERMTLPVLDGLDIEFELSRALGRPQGLIGPLMLHVLGRSAPTPDGIREDVALWWGLIDSSIDPSTVIDVSTAGNTSLFPQDAYLTIEVWTETELAGLHALSHYRDETPRGRAIAERVDQLVEWHIQRTQPDNATGHPWALHVFVQRDTPESRHFAETLLSNCMVQSGAPDAFSAWVLRNAATALS